MRVSDWLSKAETPSKNTAPRLGPRDPQEAEALVHTAVINGIVPMWLLFPAFFETSSRTRQVAIASYRITPLATALLHPLILQVLRRYGRRLPGRLRSKELVQISLLLSAASSTLGHLYAIATTILSSTATLREVFLPAATLVEPASSNVIAQACHRFLQNDLLVIAAGFIPCSYMIFRCLPVRTEKKAVQNGWKSWEQVVDKIGTSWLGLTGATLLLSPGAVLAIAHAMRC